MDGWRKYRRPVLAVLGGLAVALAGTERVSAELLLLAPRAGAPEQGSTFSAASTVAVAQPQVDLGRAARCLGQYVQYVCDELATEVAAASLTMIGGHPQPPDTPSGPSSPPPPAVGNTSPPPPPPPPPTNNNGPPPPGPPPPTTQGGQPPSSSPEPASIVTGLIGLTLAGAAGWYKRRKRPAA
jgi:hypothetical protein